jgi:hypothetical protein
MVGIDGCCAPAVMGNTITVPPISVMNSRRLICPPYRRLQRERAHQLPLLAAFSACRSWVGSIINMAGFDTRQSTLRATEEMHGKASRDPPPTRVHSRAQKKGVLSSLEGKSFSSKEE